jgi:hypothetical protein
MHARQALPIIELRQPSYLPPVPPATDPLHAAKAAAPSTANPIHFP